MYLLKVSGDLTSSESGRLVVSARTIRLRSSLLDNPLPNDRKEWWDYMQTVRSSPGSDGHLKIDGPVSKKYLDVQHAKEKQLSNKGSKMGQNRVTWKIASL